MRKIVAGPRGNLMCFCFTNLSLRIMFYRELPTQKVGTWRSILYGYGVRLVSS